MKDFQARIKLGPSGCWDWIGSFSGGYGELYGIGAHRISIGLFIGPTHGLYALHKCDRPTCVNPSHLYRGTQKQNIRDAVNRGLLVNTSGWKHTTASKTKISKRSKGKNNPMYGVHIIGEAHWNFGRTLSEETKAKISQKLLGRPGRRHTEETKIKISLKHKGKIIPLSQRLKISQSILRTKRK